MVNRINNLFSHSSILKNLVLKNLKGKYAGASLGMFWAVLNPLLLAVIIAFVFSEILKINIKNFYLFIISGMLPWSFFSVSLMESSTSITGNVNLLKQFSFPRELIPASVVLANLINLLIGLLAVTPVFIAFNTKVLLFLPLLIPVMLLQSAFTLGIALIISSCYVKFRDIGQFLNILLMFWLWLTPIFYDISMIPDKYRILFDLNPITPFLTLYRGIFIDASVMGWNTVCAALILSAVSLYSGYRIFSGQKADFLKRV